jgi:hypothetical protein
MKTKEADFNNKLIVKNGFLFPGISPNSKMLAGFGKQWCDISLPLTIHKY